MYDYDREQAQQKLARTVVMYKGQPMYVSDAKGTKGNITLLCFNLPEYNREILIRLDDKNLDAQNYKLGYINYQKSATYLSRIPRRQYSQGLRNENTNNTMQYDFTKMTRDINFRDNLSGKYPSFQECIDQIQDGGMQSRAFHRHFAVSRDLDLGFYQLEYKGSRVAYGDPQNFVLPSHMQYLNEIIRSVGVNIK